MAATPRSAATAPDSPRASSPSPPPAGVQGDLESELLGLAGALYNLGTTVINDSTKDIPRPSVSSSSSSQQPPQPPVKNVGLRVNEVITHLSTLHQIASFLKDHLIPIQVLSDVDNSRNPMMITRERLERAASENQFMNGKMKAIESYSQLLNQALIQEFPDLSPYLTMTPQPPESQQPLSLVSDPQLVSGDLSWNNTQNSTSNGISNGTNSQSNTQ